MPHKGTKSIAITADNPLAVSVENLRQPSAGLWKRVLAGSFLDELPVRLIGDKAYDSDPLDAALNDIELIAPNRRGRKCKTQDGRKLRRYRRRWKVERLFARMHNFRRLVTRREYHIEKLPRLRASGLSADAAAAHRSATSGLASPQ